MFVMTVLNQLLYLLIQARYVYGVADSVALMFLTGCVIPGVEVHTISDRMKYRVEKVNKNFWEDAIACFRLTRTAGHAAA
jgi:hypothetical protein